MPLMPTLTLQREHADEMSSLLGFLLGAATPATHPKPLSSPVFGHGQAAAVLSWPHLPGQVVPHREGYLKQIEVGMPLAS